MSRWDFGSFDPETMTYPSAHPRPLISLSKMCFLRWLAERGELEHETASQPVGDISLLNFLDGDQEFHDDDFDYTS